ncbi:MAG TPA: multifunctional oxoglutarate decarboxylase/oxoglutarate dehydrogenase thiamine pyrophosphate-binding subunit/dihydrolipoyllysine-residue succinyltransferase subunit [Frankiaceae bacterium]|nr:multifunctional oxoglutarate decarboxylase/oxoglutarate dehydrogenase thiamine pyrophosphate-binding subunit/dihydrolipoyllysine-residue succinyltransferase subunit [Frankiaceae bacterium]
MSAQSDRLAADFGTNIWLVDEIYQQYLADPNSVDRAWWDFFADYQPGESPAAERTEPLPEATEAAVATERAGGRIDPPKPAPAAPATPKAAAPKADQNGAPAGTVLKGAAARVVQNMEASLQVPTATSVRAIPAKLLEDNRTVVNRHLARNRGGKVSFTHLIGYAVVQACKAMPEMNNGFTAGPDGKPTLVTPEHVNLGLAIDLQKEDGSRQLVVPSVKNAETMDFAAFWAAYEDIVRRARNNKLTADDFAGTTISLTNPGTIGTVHSVPRLMAGQGAIVGVGAMEYPAEYQGASPQTLAEMAVSKVITLTSTYDHRIIQGAQSGDFLRLLNNLLLGEEGFYEQIFYSLRIPYEPVRWVRDITTRDGQVEKPARVVELIHAYRVRGHLMADVDPLNYRSRSHADLDILNHGLTLWDLDREFPTGGFAGQQTMRLRDVLGVLRDSYCRTVGIEYMHIQDPVQRQWIQERVEVPHEQMDREEQLRILERLNAAEAFENFLQTKYVGHKRFSLEGGESVIPLLDAVLGEAATEGLDEVAIGMPHRGRLNVLANIVGKSYGQIFREFDGDLDSSTTQGSGDVKYHLGAEGTFKAPDGSTVSVSLASNPSHLEAVDPVLEGIVRAKQDRINRGVRGYSVLPVLLHGDAAFAGQGVVAETLNLSQLSGYRTGGSMHVVVNNQLGFTTAWTAARSTVYCSDVARMVQAPIFHVNGDDPEAVVRVARLAFQFRQRFKKDVVVDMVCYRRRGHSEVDEPSFTQPLMYDLIDAHRSTRKRYTEALIGRGDITVAEAEEVLRNYQAHLETVFTQTRDSGTRPSVEPPMEPAPDGTVDTRTDAETLKRVVDVQLSAPDGFTVHPRLLPQLQRRAQMLADDAVDWALAEQFAFGSLLMEGHPVRLSGQDSRRGTFGQRHAVVVDRRTGGEYTPLCNLSPEQGPFWVYDSLLSEFAALGFEYGYAVERPDALVCWEAQFGDFVNGAQSIIDEFVVSGEAKWGQHSGLVMLLPHGYEGQGPDHSSARIERFMALCAEDNMTVAAPSTPASYFHLLRAQVKRGKRRPLVVFTPKSMLRLKTAVSAAADFTEHAFRPVIADEVTGARRVLITSGKVHYDLAQYRDKNAVTDIALVRVEQLYPLPADAIRSTLAAYAGTTDVVWVQEEPANQGAWPFMALHLPEFLAPGQTLRRISRKASASPASGSAKVHEVEQATLVKAAFE